jgi:hypothetical protein
MIVAGPKPLPKPPAKPRAELLSISLSKSVTRPPWLQMPPLSTAVLAWTLLCATVKTPKSKMPPPKSEVLWETMQSLGLPEVVANPLVARTFQAHLTARDRGGLETG